MEQNVTFYTVMSTPGYHYAYGMNGGIVATPFTPFDWLTWLFSWVVVLSLLSAVVYFSYCFWKCKYDE